MKGALLRAAGGVVALTCRNLITGKRGHAAAFLLALPLAIAGLGALSQKADGTKIFQDIAFHFSLHFMLFLLALIFGISQTSGEVEEGTAGYLYLGLVPKWTIVLIQIGLSTAALTALVFASLLGTGLVASLSSRGPLEPFWRSVAGCTLVAGIAILVSMAFYFTCGMGFRRPLAVAVTATFFWELVVPWLPVRFAAYTVTTNLRALARSLAFGGSWPSWDRYPKPYDLPDYGQASMFLSVLGGLLLSAAMVAAMNRSVEGKEAR